MTDYHVCGTSGLLYYANVAARRESRGRRFFGTSGRQTIYDYIILFCDFGSRQKKTRVCPFRKFWDLLDILRKFEACYQGICDCGVMLLNKTR